MIEALFLIAASCFFLCCFIQYRRRSETQEWKARNASNLTYIDDLRKQYMSEIQANTELRQINSGMMKLATELKADNERQKLAIREYGEQVNSLEAEVDSKSELIRKLEDQLRNLSDFSD